MCWVRMTRLDMHDYQRTIRFHVSMLLAMLWKYIFEVILRFDPSGIIGCVKCNK